ncbi:hypothetical protein VCUG_01728 [Vavraia culicis subsp. floridensis]|uniref:Secreted protein n=1 Tax=Vavraia culicis (isolate floridensis) TaxID=948595 RepID=L2GT09_VAVCU|nr:uncharacterized protein VCUG_01728 [Vavraia culicis subsp. floridensis]ELA46769.1 hypothetical protein VCUG_01728 [Vavraia culicis subsp. floridensis]
MILCLIIVLPSSHSTAHFFGPLRLIVATWFMKGISAPTCTHPHHNRKICCNRSSDHETQAVICVTFPSRNIPELSSPLDLVINAIFSNLTSSQGNLFYIRSIFGTSRGDTMRFSFSSDECSPVYWANAQYPTVR